MRVLMIILLSCCLSKGYSQQSGNDYKRLIDSAIGLKVKNIIEFSRNAEQKKSLLSNIYLIDENELPYSYTSTNYGVELNTINIKSQESKKILKKGITAWKIFPELKSNKLVITIILFRISYKNKLVHYSKGPGTQVIFEYSCEEKKWIQTEFKNSRD